MGKPLEIVNKFYDATNTRKSIKETAGLIADDLTFNGPVIQTAGAKEYLGLLEKFLPTHVETRMIKQFEDGNEVCSIYDLVQRTPTGGTITLRVADWILVRNGRVAEQKIYYDPREFVKAFGL
jgi:ketosteroid isomerase-like protein